MAIVWRGISLQNFLLFPFLLLILIGGTASAHEKSHGSSLSYEEQLRAEAAEAHETVEAEPSHLPGVLGKLHEAARKLNILHFRSNLIRTYSIHENDKIRKYLNDVLFVMSISHPLEMSIAPILLSAGVMHQWEAWQTAVATLLGTAIWLPGLDPLCIILIGGYSVSRPKILGIILTPYRAFVHYGRRFAWYEMKLLSQALFLPQLFESFFDSQPRLGLLRTLEKNQDSPVQLKVTRSDDGIRLEAFERNVPLFELTFKEGIQREPWLDSVQVHKSSWGAKQHSKQIKILGWNVRNAVETVLNFADRPQILASRFYVRDVGANSASLKVAFKPGAIGLGNRLELRRHPFKALIERCRSL